MSEILRAEGLVKDYKVPKKDGWFGNDNVRALDGVSLSVAEGETVAIVGESGSGKSTLGRLLLRLEKPDAGAVHFEGQELGSLSSGDLRKRRRDMQMVFQDPYASLDPRWKADEIVTENLAVHDGLKGERMREEAVRLLATVGLDSDMLDRFPHQFSGGQRQRLAIARAIATRPKLLIADEPVSALDLDLQVQILDLLKKLRAQMRLSLVFITHDLKLLRGFADRVLVMKDGQVVEEGPLAQVWARPQHPFTQELLASVLMAERPATRS
jgi:ABC-type oligopeptide transport system ATPase subunit